MKIKCLIIGNEALQKIATDKIDKDLADIEQSGTLKDTKTRVRKLAQKPLDLILLGLETKNNKDLLETLEKEPSEGKFDEMDVPHVYLLVDQLNPQDADEVWRYPPVIGYSRKEPSETWEEIQKVVHQIHNRKVRDEQEEGCYLIGTTYRSEETSPQEETSETDLFPKFITLHTGHMRDFFADLKWTAAEVTGRPEEKLEEPFRGVPPATWLNYYHFSKIGTGEDPSLEKRLNDARAEIAKERRLVSNAANMNLQNPHNYAILANPNLDKERDKEFHQIFGQSEKKREFEHILIEGETGSGKSLITQWIHQFYLSRLPTGSYTPKYERISCTNISERLMEGEIFGYMRGAYTGAYQTQPGKIIMAYNGTVFLDEIGDLTPRLQSQLLVFLDEGQVFPVGWVCDTLYVPVRIVAATNKNLRDEIAKGRFREDLYYRFTHRIQVPPLRDRKEDLEYLIDHILQKPDINPQRKDGERIIHKISKGALEKLREWDYPGNYRELEYALKDAVKRVKSSRSRIILEEDIQFEEPALPITESAFILPKVVEADGAKYLLQWNYHWGNYSFIGGRFEEEDQIVGRPTIEREVKDKLKLSPDQYKLVFLDGDGPKEIYIIQYSRREHKRKFYHFLFYGVRFEDAKIRHQLLQQQNGLNVLAGEKDFAIGTIHGKPLSETILQAFSKLGKETLEKVPESFND